MAMPVARISWQLTPPSGSCNSKRPEGDLLLVVEEIQKSFQCVLVLHRPVAFL